MFLFLYLWDSASHLEVFSLGFESIAGIVEAILAVCFARAVFALRKEPTEEIKRQKERLEAALGLIAAVFFIVAIAACWRILILNKSERVESDRRTNAMSNDLIAANQAVTKAQKAAREAQNASQPKPLDERLRICLDRIDKTLLVTLKTKSINGRLSVSGKIRQSDEDELERICSEPDASKFITALSPGASYISSAGLPGAWIEVSFDLSTNLLKESSSQ